MSSPKILIQLDSDAHASVFDAVVAIDAGVDQLLQYARVETSAVEPLVHGAMFTRGGSDLKSTAIFIGGSSTTAGEALFKAVKNCFFGPVRVSVLMDSNGCNTTAAAAVLSASRHLELRDATALVLGGTGPVGQRVARLLLGCGANVRLASRSLSRAEEMAHKLGAAKTAGTIRAVEAYHPASVVTAAQDCQVIISAGAAGVTLVSLGALANVASLRVAIDLNAVPPLGIDGIAATDKAVQRGNRFDYGALGVGGLKMKIHKAAVKKLFTDNQLLLDAEQIIEIGREWM